MIIKTPQPDLEERLVVVPAESWEAWHKECDLAIVRAARLLGEVGK